LGERPPEERETLDMVIHTLASLLSRPHGGGESLFGALLGGVFFIILLVVALGSWLFFGFLLSRIFAKANKPSIAAYIPIWNAIVILEMVGKPIWWLLFAIIPGVNLILYVYVKALLLERFGVESPMSYVLAIVGMFTGVVSIVLLIWGAFGDVTYTAPNQYGSTAPAY
jgi:Family of unknown function (DUF5684)